MSVYTTPSLPFGLGRLPNADPRSRSFAVSVPDGTAIKSKTWKRHVPSMDQGDIGDCVPHAGAQTLMTSPFWNGTTYTEDEVIDDYVAVTANDPFPGAYKRDGSGEDTGTDGTSLGNFYVAQKRIKAFTHVFNGVDEAKAMIQHKPGILGIDWRYDMFYPDAKGRLSCTGAVVGGHEIELEGISLLYRAFIINNSWGPKWGVSGRAFLPFDFVASELQNGNADIIFFEV